MGQADRRITSFKPERGELHRISGFVAVGRAIFRQQPSNEPVDTE
jgi:hypothetical protein